MPTSEEQLRAMVDLRIMVVIDHPDLREESAYQQNWGFVERFNDECFTVKLEEGVFDYWIFSNDTIEFCAPFAKGDSLHLTGLCPGYKAIGVRGPKSGALVEELMHRHGRGG